MCADRAHPVHSGIQVLKKIRLSRLGIRGQIAKLADDLLHAGSSGSGPDGHDRSGEERRSKQRDLAQALVRRNAIQEIRTKATEDLGGRGMGRVGLIPEHGLDGRGENRGRPVVQEVKDLRQECGERRQRKHVVGEPQRRVQALPECHEQLLIDVAPGARLTPRGRSQGPEKGGEGTATTLRLRTAAEAITTPGTGGTKARLAIKRYVIVMKEILNDGVRHCRDQAAVGAGQLQNPEEDMPKVVRRRTENPKHVAHNGGNLRRGRRRSNPHALKGRQTSELLARLRGVVLGRRLRNRGGRRRILAPKLLI
jgi:hypothetical protein